MATLTAAFVKGALLPIGKTKARYFDDKLPGFILEVRSTTRTFYIRYRDRHGRQRELSLGRLGVVTADQARRRALEIKAEASLGGDPAGERDRLRAVPTFSEFVENQYEPFARERLRSFRDHASFYRRRLKRWWGSKPIDTITAADVADMQNRLRAEKLSGASINRYTAYVRRVFNLAIQWELLDGRNPAQRAHRHLENARVRYLTRDQLVALLRALKTEPNTTAASLIALLAATGARRGEAMGARRADIDLVARMWTVPLSKSGRTRYITLSDAAVTIIEQHLERAKASVWLFPGRNPEKPVDNVNKAWKRVKAAAGLDADLRIHDLRHAFASTLVQQGHTLQLVGKLLGHSQFSVTERYAHLANQQLLSAANQALPDFS